nr:LPD23 domain-containing protein [Ruthenibacterium lactatiformans]
MQKSVKKSNKKTGAAGKYTASGAFGGAQPSNLVELIEAQRGKAASSAGKKPAADTALANEWANLQLQSFGQFGADTLSPTWGRVEETPEMTAAEREREAQWYEQNANAYNALGADGQSTVQRANDAANRWDIANNMYPWMLDTSGLGMPIDQQLAMADAYEERRQATAALEQAANSLPADVDARSLSRYAQQLENARYAQELETSARQGAGEAPILHNAASVAANAWNLPAALDYAKQWARNTFTGDYAPIDVNTPAQTMNIYRDAVRDETGRNIEEGLGGGLAGKAASFAYQTGMSWADSLANMAMSGGNPYLSGVLMGSGTMTSTVRSAKEKGASDSQAMGAGVAAGIFEGLFEQYSIENLSWMAKSDPRTFLDVVKNLGKSILGEGSEELFTELANAAADTLIMGDLSDYNLAVRQYKAQGESEEEARRHAGWDVAKQAGLAFAGGGLMGFGSAAGGMAYNGAANRYAAPRAVESGSFYNALQYGLAQGEDTAAGRLARELAGRDTASRADVMRMLRAAESRQAEGGPGAQALVDPQLYTRAEVQGMSAGEVRENYDAIQESMRLWDKNGELAQGVNSPETQTSAAQEAAPVRVGKNTVIQRPYNGTVPKVKKDTQYEIVSISSTALEQAETQITAAQAQAESGKSFKKSLTSFYREAMGNLFGGRAVQVENVRFEDQPYDVTLNTKVISKVISDPHLTAEKLAVFRHIENVVRNAEYLGSGQYTAHGAKTKPATRYDYFETQAIIGGQEYTVSFDVEVYPDRNNYRTHRVVNNLELSPAADGTNNTKKERPPVSAVQTAYSGADARTIQAAAERGFVPYNSIAQTGENATGFSGPAAERTSDVSAVPSALNPAPRLYTRAEVQGMSAGEVRENYDAIQESMRLWDKNGELLQSAETETARRMALETGRAGKTDLDWLEHLAGTAKMELQYVFQPGSGVQAAVQGRRITVNLGGAGYAFGAAVHELGHSMKAADAKAYAKFESAVLGLAQSDAALEQIARQTAADYLSPDSPARAGLLDAQGNIDAAALNEEISLRLAQELVADPEKLVRAVERDRGLMETFLDFVRGLKNRIAIRLSGSERAMLDEAERTLVNLLRGEAGSVAGEKYSFVRATDAEQIARAQELEAQGENAKTIWSETHLTRDGGGAWVQEINDHDAKPRPDGDARGETGGRLADYLEHPELYEAVPGIADINVKLGTLPESEKGKYSSKKRMLHFAENTFKNKSMSDIMHEVQHAIQNEQKLATGGSRKLAYAALVSDAYEAVRNTPEFQSLQTKEERLHYLEEAAAKQASAPDIETAATNGYVNLGGEKMARQTAKRWYYTKDQREKTWPDVAGNVLDKSVESQRIVETLERIGYTKNEIRGLLGG